MYSFHVLVNARDIVEHLGTNIAGNRSLVSLPRFRRSSAVHLPLVFVDIIVVRETFVAEFAGKLPFLVRLNVSISTSSRVVTLLVCTQLIDVFMVTVTDLTNDVAIKIPLQKIHQIIGQSRKIILT